ncbi:MAG: adenylyltransferase/cytidyltransferase family protein [Alphaproteobacteria bacterium]|nr:adenylyltransferase/cytidyltransferase family protein [Alphaproteobacteria bacterium]
MTKVMVSGCFDVLHAGHIAFLEEAAQYGELYVSVGSDKTILHYKNRPTLYTQEERKYMLEALRCVHQVFIGPDNGIMDFAPLLETVKPDIFFVNQDGDSPLKRSFIESKGIKYIVSKRLPHDKLPSRSTTAIRSVLKK